MNRKELLERKKRLEGQLADINLCLKTNIREFSYFDDAEAFYAFEKIYLACREHIEYVFKHGYDDRDGPQRIFEVAMTQCLGEDVWKFYNKRKEKEEDGNTRT